MSKGETGGGTSEPPHVEPPKGSVYDEVPLKNAQLAAAREDLPLKKAQTKLAWFQIVITPLQTLVSGATLALLAYAFRVVQGPAGVIQIQRDSLAVEQGRYALERTRAESVSKLEGSLTVVNPMNLSDRSQRARFVITASLSLRNAGVRSVDVVKIKYTLWLGQPCFSMARINETANERPNAQSPLDGCRAPFVGAPKMDASDAVAMFTGLPLSAKSDVAWRHVGDAFEFTNVENGTGPLATGERSDSSAQWYVTFAKDHYAFAAITANVAWCETFQSDAGAPQRKCSVPKETAKSGDHVDWTYASGSTLIPEPGSNEANKPTGPSKPGR